MRYLIALGLVLLGCAAGAQDWEDRQRFGATEASTTLRVLSSTDTDLFSAMLEGFVAKNSDIAIDYIVASTSDIDRVFRQTPDAFDVVISSAMDLQFKLANDGYTQTVDSFDYPDWAQWRRSLFAFTSEPAAIVVNRAAFAETGVPQTRQALIRSLRDQAEKFRGKLGTYDVRQSGLGYLFATQDARTSETYWSLMEVMGNLETRLYCCSGSMIDDVAAGRILVAYNVLGSYALARADLSDKIEIIVPTDFRTVMMRTAFVSSKAKSFEAAETFLMHLLLQASQPNLSERTVLPFLDLGQDGVGQSTISLEPALLTYLDRLKSQRFLREWTNAVIQ